jgi:hypothetical protein
MRRSTRYAAPTRPRPDAARLSDPGSFLGTSVRWLASPVGAQRASVGHSAGDGSSARSRSRFARGGRCGRSRLAELRCARRCGGPKHATDITCVPMSMGPTLAPPSKRLTFRRSSIFKWCPPTIAQRRKSLRARKFSRPRLDTARLSRRKTCAIRAMVGGHHRSSSPLDSDPQCLVTRKFRRMSPLVESWAFGMARPDAGPMRCPAETLGEDEGERAAGNSRETATVEES